MKRLLIVVDYQVDFVDGTLGFEGAETLEAPILKKVEAYRESGDEIVFTFDTHDEETYCETQEGRNLPVMHCGRGSVGHELYGELARALRSEDKLIYKPAFASSELFEWLRDKQREAERGTTIPYKSIELVGLVSNICVLSNAVLAKAACPEVPIIIDSSCTASFDKRLHQAALDVMAGLQMKIL